MLVAVVAYAAFSPHSADWRPIAFECDIPCMEWDVERAKQAEVSACLCVPLSASSRL